MPAVPPAKPGSDSVVWPEDPWVADGRAADDPTLEGGPVVTSPVIPSWPESTKGEPSIPSHAGLNPTTEDPQTAPFPTGTIGQSPDAAVMKTAPPQPAAPSEAADDVDDTVPPAPAAETAASAEAAEVDTADATLETLPPEVAAVEASEEESAGPSAEEAVIEAIAEDEPGTAGGNDEAAEAVAEEPEPVEALDETPAPVEAAEPEREPEPVTAAEPVTEPEAVTEPEVTVPEPIPEPTPEPAKAEAPEPPAPVETPAEPATPAAASPFAPASPAIPSWAPNAPKTAAARPQPDAPTQWPGINVPAWAPQPAASHPGTANPLPGAASPYVDPARPAQPAPAPAPTPVQPAAPQPAAATPAPAPTAPATPAAGTAKTSSSWEVVEQKRAAEPTYQGPSPEDKSYAEWFAWAKRSGAPAGACHAAAQGAFRALAAGHDMNTAVQWATLAMASPPGLVGQSRQIYCAWYSLGNIDLKLPTAQAHAFANGAIQALEQGADSMGAHQAGLLAAGITGG